MERLTTLDAGFLRRGCGPARLHRRTAVMAGPAPDRSTMRTFVQRVAACPRFGQRLRLHPLGLSAPEWVEHPNFGVMAHHVRRTALPPGDDDALYRLVADVMAMRLDRDRPLWGDLGHRRLADNRWAMTKVHHCMADGIAATHMFTSLCDDGVDELRSPWAARQARPASPGTLTEANPVKLVVRLLARHHYHRPLPRSVRHTALPIAIDLARPASSSTLTGPSACAGTAALVSPMRRHCAGVRSSDVTINDVALAAIAEVTRNTMLRR